MYPLFNEAPRPARKDKRRSPRFDAWGEVETVVGDTRVRGELINLSTSGFFVELETEIAIRPGTRLELVIVCAAPAICARVTGILVRCERSPDGRLRAGIQLVGLSSRVAKKIRDFGCRSAV